MPLPALPLSAARYPQELFDALLGAAHLPPHAKLLEIGPGTGQATEELAKLGYSIIAIELGSNLAQTSYGLQNPFHFGSS